MNDDEPIDLEGVRRGDALLDQAKQIREREGHTKRPVDETTLRTIMDDQTTYSVADVADLTGYSEETIRRHIRADKLKAAGGGADRSTYRISKVELERWWRDKGGGDLFATEEGVRHHVSVLLAERLQPYRVDSTVLDGGEHIILEYGIDVEGEPIGSVSTQVDDRSAREVATELVGKVPGGDRD